MNFIYVEPNQQNQWRAIILFGQNVASYKFALAKSLIEYQQQNNNTIISLDELALPYALQLCEHLKQSPKQTISAHIGKLINACIDYNQGIITTTQLHDISKKEGFKYVLDAFHIVNQSAIPDTFFQVETQSKQKKLILTDTFLKMMENKELADILLRETESRWNLVEKAWELNLNKHLIGVQYDHENQRLFTIDKQRRVDITSSRGALNGYQKGRCFYCFKQISIVENMDNLADIDHFFPHCLVYTGESIFQHLNINGVWNLVLACQSCNRGENGKFARIPSISLLHRLYQRNEYLISSHHPLRETLMAQTGRLTEQRQQFLQQVYQSAKQCLIHEWQPIQHDTQVF